MKSPALIFGREPSVILGLIAVCVQFISAFVMEVEQDTQTAVNAAAAALIGFIVAWKVKDGTVAALTGLAQAGLALGMNMGLDLSTAKQAAAMAFVTVFAQAFVRTQVTAPVPAGAKQRPAAVA